MNQYLLFRLYYSSILLLGLILLLRAVAAAGVVVAFTLILGSLPLLSTKARSYLRSWPLWVWIFLGSFAIFLINGKNVILSSHDNAGTNLSAVAFVENQTFEFSPYLNKNESWPYWARVTPRGTFPALPLGMVPFAIPVFALAKLLGVNLIIEQWKLAKLAASLLSAIALAMLYVLATRVVSRSTALLATLLLMLGSPLFTNISQGLWTHTGVFFWQSFVLFLEFRLHPTRSRDFLQGFLAAQTLSCRLTALSFLAPFSIFKTYRSRSPVFLLGVLVGFFPWGVFHFLVYGHVFGPHISQSGSFDFSLATFLNGLLGLSVSPSRGFLIYMPWVILIPPLLFPRHFTQLGNPKRAFVIVGVLSFFLQWFGMSFWGAGWDGGWSYGPRFFGDVLAVLFLLAAFSLEATRRLKSAVVLLVGAFILHAGGAFCPPAHNTSWFAIADNLWSWKNAPFIEAYLGRHKK